MPPPQARTHCQERELDENCRPSTAMMSSPARIFCAAACPFIIDSHQAALQVEQTACCRRTEVLEQELTRGDGPIVQGRATRIGRECIDDAVVILRVSTPRSAP